MERAEFMESGKELINILFNKYKLFNDGKKIEVLVD